MSWLVLGMSITGRGVTELSRYGWVKYLLNEECLDRIESIYGKNSQKKPIQAMSQHLPQLCIGIAEDCALKVATSS